MPEIQEGDIIRVLVDEDIDVNTNPTIAEVTCVKEASETFYATTLEGLPQDTGPEYTDTGDWHLVFSWGSLGDTVEIVERSGRRADNHLKGIAKFFRKLEEKNHEPSH